MANISVQTVCRILPSSEEKVGKNGNRYFLQQMRVFSGIEDNSFQFPLETFFVSKPLRPGLAMVRFSVNPSRSGMTPSVLYRFPDEDLPLFIQFLENGKIPLNTKPSVDVDIKEKEDEPVFAEDKTTYDASSNNSTRKFFSESVV
jgi:hypothetical protein